MNKQTTKSRNTIYTDNIEKDEWSNLVTQVRNTQKKAKITDVNVEGETATIHYDVQGFPDRKFSQNISAEINPESKSPLEKLLENHGYAPHETERLVNEPFDVNIERAENGIKFSMPIENDSKDHTTSSSQVTKTLLAAGIVGCIPLVNLFILAELLFESTQRKTFTNLDLVSSIGLTISITILYIALPLLYTLTI